MNPQLVAQIGEALFQAVELGVQYGPKIIADLRLLWGFATSGTTITPEQQLLADTTLSESHQAIQAKVAQDAQQDMADQTAVPDPQKSA